MSSGLGRADRWILASFSAAAGIIHVVMAPSHMGASRLEGWGFVVSAWLQLALAVGIVGWPRRWMLWLTLALNVVLVGFWAVSRSVGLPFGAHANHPEAISFVDGSCVAFELLMVGLAAIWLFRPVLVSFTDGVFAVAVPLAVFGLATAAIASPEARDHSAHTHGDHAASGHVHDPSASPPADDKGLAALMSRKGHPHPVGEVELDAATQARLTAELLRTEELVALYPTIAAAEAAGGKRVGPFGPGVGQHIEPPGYQVNEDGDLDPTDLPHLVYDGLGPDAPLAGFMFYVLGEIEPEGFAGPNDHWHLHTNMCLVVKPDGTIDAPFGADNDWVTDDMCADLGGELTPVSGYMLHVWTVPGYESSLGVFSEVNPRITCPDGTYNMIDFAETRVTDTACRT